MTDRWVNAVVAFRFPLDDVPPDAEPAVKLQAAADATEDLAILIIDRVGAAVEVSWEDAETDGEVGDD